MIPSRDPVREQASAPRAAEHHRLFVVGCSRSSTTLLQSRLANHPDLHPFPETGLFLRLFGMRSSGGVHPGTLGLCLGRHRKALRRAVLAPSGAGPPPGIPGRRRRIGLARRSVHASAGFLDRVALARGKGGWIEKTPRHHIHALTITRLLPRARVIHIVRDGHEVIASLHQRARLHPDRFPRQAKPGHAVRQWHRALHSREKCMGQPRHHFVVFDDLLASPERELERLQRECALPPAPHGLEHPPANGDPFVRPAEVWKEGIHRPLHADSARHRVRHSRKESADPPRLDLARYAVLVEGIHEANRA